MSNDFWPIFVEWKQEWYALNQENLVFVTDENLLIENVDKQVSETKDTSLAENMLKDIGVKIATE